MLSLRIREIRLARGLNQVELARLLGVTKQSVSNWENDNIQPSIDMLIKIASVLSVSTDYLLALDDRKMIDVSNISSDAAGHIQQLIDDLKAK